MDLVNPVTQYETAALGDANMRCLQRGDVLQLERKGYYIVDTPLAPRAAAGGQAAAAITLFSIPDGRVKTVGAGSAAGKAATSTTPPAAAAANGSVQKK